MFAQKMTIKHKLPVHSWCRSTQLQTFFIR